MFSAAPMGIEAMRVTLVRIRLRLWGCGISPYPSQNGRTPFSATPSYQIGTQKAIQLPPDHLAAQLQKWRITGYLAALRDRNCSRCSAVLLSASCAPLLQAILRSKSPTQQKYNFVPFKREKRMQNAHDLLFCRLFLQDCLHIALMSAHGAHHVRFNVRAHARTRVHY